jgi:hypothetical protein
MRKHDQFLTDQETIANAGVDGMFYGTTSALLDPITLPLWFMPFGKGYQMAGTLGKIGRLTGLATAEMAAGEAIMHHIDMSRDPNETRKNLFIAASAASTIGLLHGALAKNIPENTKRNLVDSFRGETGRKYDEGIILYHGTHPEAVFDVVDLKYVGTGEGKQFQGWGLYMASKRGIANWYAETVSMGTLAAYGAKSREYVSRMNWLQSLIEKRTGNLYEMEVKESAIKKFLDWNVPLSAQSDDVKMVLAAERNFGLTLADDATGHTLYRAMTRRVQAETGLSFGEAQREVSQILKKAGIKGNKYLDRPSRKAGTRVKEQNYVAFDADDIKVLRRNKTRINDPSYRGDPISVTEAMTEVSAALTGRSAGAMEVPNEWADVNMEAPQKGFGLHKGMVRTPILRMAASTDVGLAEPAKFLPELTQSGIEKNKYLLGISEDFNPVDFVVQRERRSLGNTRMALMQAKKQILKDYGDELTELELRKLVSQVVVYGDDHPVYRNPYGKILQPIINDARKFRQGYEQRMKAGAVGMMDENVKPHNKFYGPRSYDLEAIRNNPDAWQKAVIRGYRSKGDTRTDAELAERAQEAFYNASTISKLGGGGDFQMMRPMQTKAGSLKQITLDFDDSFIEDFLLRDVLDDHDKMIRNLLPEIILRERYSDVERTVDGLRVNYIEERFKKEFREKHGKLLKRYANAQEKAKQATNAEQKTKYQKSADRTKKKADKMLKVHEQNLIDLRHTIQKISGVGEDSSIITAGMAEFLGELRAYSQGAHLGNSALASLHEPITSMMVMGFTPIAKAFGVLGRQRQLLKPEIEKLRAVGAGMDLRSQQTTAMQRAEIEDPGFTKGWKSWGRRKVAPFMYKWNGQNLFNTVSKTGVATAMQDMIIRHALGKQAAKVGSPEYMTEISTMSKLGIGEPELKWIKEELDKGLYKKIDDVYFADFDKFSDPEIRGRFGDALAMFGDYTVVGHSAGATPIMLDNPVGKLFTMYRNVFFNMQSKTIIPLAQRLARGDLRTARFLVASFGMSWIIYQVRMMGKVGWDMDKFQEEWDKMAIQDHVREAIAASGLSGLTEEMLGAADNLSNGRASNLLGLNESTKNYYNRNLGLTGLSPAISWADKITRGTIGAAVSEGNWTQKEINGLFYSLPGRTIPYLDPALDALQSSVVSEFPESATSARERSTR